MVNLKYERQMQDEKREMRQAMADAVRRDAIALGIDPAKLQDHAEAGAATSETGTAANTQGHAPTAAEAATAAGASGDAALGRTVAPLPRHPEKTEGGRQMKRKHFLKADEKLRLCRDRDAGATWKALAVAFDLGTASTAANIYGRMIAAGLWVPAGQGENTHAPECAARRSAPTKAAAAPVITAAPEAAAPPAADRLDSLGKALSDIADAVGLYGDTYWRAVEIAKAEVGR